jgi:methyl-accepting chemotaxis protein
MDLLAPLRLGARALEDLHRVAVALEAAAGAGPKVDARVRRLEGRIDHLERAADALNAVAREIVTGGDDLRRSADALRETSERLHDGGQDLLGATRVQARRTGEMVGEAETIADTLEPLQDAAERVGRISERLPGSRRRR